MSVRELTIDGQLPFAQADSLTFAYDSGWQTATLSDDKGTPYQFYFTAGRHTIRLRAGLGAYRDILTQTDACSDELNRLYRQIVVVTGGEPDIYRDYQFDVLIPDTLKDMEAASARLKALETSIRAAGFSGNQGTDAIRRLYTQMDSMTADPAEIAQRLRMYRDNISSLATWRNSMTEQPLTIDSKEPDYDKMLDFMMTETRFSQLPKLKGETAYEMFEKTKQDAMRRHRRLKALAEEKI